MDIERRKEELEKKRQKLAELRRAREERKQVFSHATSVTSITSEAPKERQDKTRKDVIDDLVKSLLDKSTSPNEQVPAKHEEIENPEKVPATASASVPTHVGASPSTSVPQSPLVSTPHNSRFIPEFSSFEAVVLDIAPKETVLYNKEVQTTENSFGPPPPSENEIRAKLLKEQEEIEKTRQAALDEERIRAEAEKKKVQKLKDISEEEKKKIVCSAEFADFIDYSTKIVERALNENYDFMKDYSTCDDVESDEKTGNRVKYMCSFFDDQWSKNRSVTDVNWSKKNPELVVASYNKNPIAMNEPDGVVLVWSLRLLERPEYVFHSQSDVLTTTFSEFHPTLVVGGTYSGQVVIWDMRAKSLPVLKTPLSSNGHTHPVYSMQMVGTQNAHNLVTASTDGLVCSWQLDMLQPQEHLELVHAEHNKTDEVSVTALGFPDNETAAFWVGTEEGNVYQANRYGRAGGKAGINQYDSYKGHWGPITGLHFHPLFGPVDFSDLFLTSSVDWTVKLWRAKSISKPSTSPQNITPLYSFEGSDDYVYDVKWSPSHPALFASVDGTGKFAVWNLNVDTEIPIVSTQVGQGKALNKIQWDKEGRKTAIGSSDGRVHIYDIGELSQPRSDEWNIMQKTISEMIDTTESHGGRYALAK